MIHLSENVTENSVIDFVTGTGTELVHTIVTSEFSLSDNEFVSQQNKEMLT
jgi:hypothetical protein